jgi:hypothetical protein
VQKNAASLLLCPHATSCRIYGVFYQRFDRDILSRSKYPIEIPIRLVMLRFLHKAFFLASLKRQKM